MAVELFDLVDSPSTIAVSVADDFFCFAYSKSSGLQDGFLGEGSPDDNGKNMGEPWANISASYQVGVLLDDVAAENKVLASGVSFPTEQPFLKTCYHNNKKSNQRGLHLWP